MTEREKYEELLANGDIDEVPKLNAGAFCNGRRTGLRRYCSRTAGWGTSHKGEGRCKTHGGASVRGLSHPSLKSGIYSKYMQVNLLARYQESLNDPELLTIRNEVASCEAHIKGLFEALRDLPSGKRNETSAVRLAKSVRNAKAAVAKGLDSDGFLAVLNQFEHLLAEINDEQDIWTNLGEWMDRKQRLVESENKRMLQSETMVSAAEISTLIGGILSVLRENIKERKTLAAIGRGLSHPSLKSGIYSKYMQPKLSD